MSFISQDKWVLSPPSGRVHGMTKISLMYNDKNIVDVYNVRLFKVVTTLCRLIYLKEVR